jgi:hypothetical protein
MDEIYIVKNKDRFILISTPIDWKLGRWYTAATKIQAMYLQSGRQIISNPIDSFS